MTRRIAFALCVSPLLVPLASASTVTIPCSKHTSIYNESGALTGGYLVSTICGVNSQGNVRRCLLKFEVASAIPANATITSAAVTMEAGFFESTAPTTMGLRPLLRPWQESLSTGDGVYVGAPALAGDATWTHYQYPSAAWTVPGGDAGGLHAMCVVQLTGTYTWGSTPELVADVQSFLVSPGTNHGWLLSCTDEASTATTKAFYPRNHFTNAPRLVVTYTVPVPTNPFSVFCHGDGNGTPCPCSNGATNRGCANSSTVLGATLGASGTPNVSSDSLVFNASGLPGPAMFVQGTDTIANGLGVTFGDGLLCVTGAITRLGIAFPTAGVASYPNGLAPNPVHVAGAPINAGDVRKYQCWYRDAMPGYCTEATYNLTQGVSVVWGP